MSPKKKNLCEVQEYTLKHFFVKSLVDWLAVGWTIPSWSHGANKSKSQSLFIKKN